MSEKNKPSFWKQAVIQIGSGGSAGEFFLSLLYLQFTSNSAFAIKIMQLLN